MPAAVPAATGERASSVAEPGSEVAGRPPADPQQAGLQAMQVRYLRHAGHRIAYATVGSGPRLVMAPAWITSLDVIASGRDPRSSLLARLAECTQLTLFDRWGCGLSRGLVSDFSLAESVSELEAMLEHTGPAAVLAMSQSGPTAVTLAARRPDLVTGLVLFGTFADPADVFQNPEFAQSLVGLTRSHWGMAARLLANLYRPGASADAVRHMARVLRDSADGEVAAGYLAEMYVAEVGDLMEAVTAPALVMHYRGDRMIPFVGGQQLASGLPEARLMPLDGAWHLPDASDLPRIVDAITGFLAEDASG